MPTGSEDSKLPRIAVYHDTLVALSDQIAFQLTYLIVQGSLRPGQRLWSVRQLSAELRINHNTVLVALSLLQKAGLIEASTVRGYYVCGRQQWNAAWVAAVRDAMNLAPAILDQLRARNIPLSQFFQALVLAERQSLSEMGEGASLSVVFAECNPASLAYFGDKLDAVLSVRVQRRLLSDLEEDHRIPDIAVTNIYHLGTLSDRYDAGKIALVGLSVRVSDDTRNALTRIPAASRIAVIAPAHSAMSNMAMIAATAVPTGHEILPLNLEDEAELYQGLSRADVILIHEGNRNILEAGRRKKSFVTYSTEYDPLSIAYLQETIAKIMGQRIGCR